MRPVSLHALLARRFTAFAIALALLFAGTALLLLFMLEDSFIDRRLHALAAGVADARTAVLPAGFELRRVADAGAEIRARTAHRRDGAIAEFRLADGRYVHVLRLSDVDGTPLVLVHDVTGDLTVTAGVARAVPYLLGLVLVLALVARWLSTRMVRTVAQRAEALVALMRDAAEPAAVRAYAGSEPLRELAAFATLLADGWEQRLAALQRERDTLAFLAHELRTPLQSARTSIALLDAALPGDSARAAAVERLRRAVDRLARAGNAVLWLSSDAEAGRETTALRPLLEELAAQLAPLAASRGQAIAIACSAGLEWRGPRDVLDAIAGNLLLNAVQHGGAGTVEIDATAAALCVRNPAGAAGSAGFGIGLQIVERLAARCGWELQRDAGGHAVIHRIVRDGPCDRDRGGA